MPWLRCHVCARLSKIAPKTERSSRRCRTGICRGTMELLPKDFTPPPIPFAHPPPRPKSPRVTRRTHQDIILTSLYRLSGDGCDDSALYSGIDFDRVAIAAWQAFPTLLSLRNHPEFPDCKRAEHALCGRTGLVRLGLVQRISGRRYGVRVRLTPDGIEQARAILAADTGNRTKSNAT